MSCFSVVRNWSSRAQLLRFSHETTQNHLQGQAEEDYLTVHLHSTASQFLNELIVVPLLYSATQSSKIETGKLGSTSSNAISSLKGPHFQRGTEKSNLSEQKL